MPTYNRETFAIIKVLFGIILNYLLLGEKEGICFHIFPVKYAYILRSHSDETSTYVPSSELSMTFNMLL